MKMNLTLTLDWSGDEKVDFRFWNRSISIRGNKYKDIVSAVSAAKRIAKQLNIQVGAVEYLDSENGIWYVIDGAAGQFGSNSLRLNIFRKEQLKAFKKAKDTPYSDGKEDDSIWD